MARPDEPRLSSKESRRVSASPIFATSYVVFLGRTAKPEEGCRLKQVLTVNVPVETVSELNRRDHWSARHRRAKQQKELTLLLLRTAKVDRASLRPPFVVTMTRVAPGVIRDSDNLASSTKAIRDAIALYLQIDDADVLDGATATWIVNQEKGRSYSLKISIAAASCVS